MATTTGRFTVLAAYSLAALTVFGSVPPLDAAQQKPPAARPKVVETSGCMQIEVLDDDGKPVPRAAIHVAVWTDEPFDHNQDYTCGERGTVEVKLPKTLTILRIWARSDGLVPLFANWWPEGQDNGFPIPEEFTFRLVGGSVIGGVVRNDDGQPIAGAKVEVMHVSRANDMKERPVIGTWLATGDAARVTDADGRWSLDNVPPDTAAQVRLKISHPDYIDDQTWGQLQGEQKVTMQALRSQTATIVMHRGINVHGTVTDADGKPLAGAVVVWGDRPYWQEGSQEVRTGNDGAYRFPPLPAGPMTVTVVAQGWAPELRKIEITPENPPVDFRLRPGKTLQLRFVDLAGKPIAKAGVGIVKWRGGESLYNYKHSNVLDTNIPTTADENGVYEWTWAPHDEVTYQFYRPAPAQGARVTATLVAGGVAKITLPGATNVAVRATDAETGEPVDEFTVVPVIELSKGNVAVAGHRVGQKGGKYLMPLERAGVAYRVRIEALGYRCALSDAVFRLGDAEAKYDFKLQRAAPAAGRLVDADGAPVAGGIILLVTATQRLDLVQRHERDGPNRTKLDGGRVHRIARADGTFSFPAQYEQYFIIVFAGRGYVECSRQPDEMPGELVLQKYAHVEGRLFEGGKPVAGAEVTLRPLRLGFGEQPRINDLHLARTDDDGRFVFARVPPVKCALAAEFSAASDHPIASSESVPLDLKPGEQVAVDLGAKGALVRGRVVLKGEQAREIDLTGSVHYLLRKQRGIKPPLELAVKQFDWRNGWSDAWTATPEGTAYLQTLHHYSVKLDRDGTFRAGGLPEGEYELALNIRRQPDERPVGERPSEPVGGKVVRFTVSEGELKAGVVDLGEIGVDVVVGPEPGDVVPDFDFDLLDGVRRKLSELRGKLVLVDFRTDWSAASVESLPAINELHAARRADDRFLVVSIHLDGAPKASRDVAAQRKLAWMQGYVGDPPDALVFTRFALSSLPAYLLVGPDGKLLLKSYSLDDVRTAVDAALKTEKPREERQE